VVSQQHDTAIDDGTDASNAADAVAADDHFLPFLMLQVISCWTWHPPSSSSNSCYTLCIQTHKSAFHSCRSCCCC